MHKGFSPLFNPDIPQDLKDSLFKPSIKKKMTYLDGQLAKNKYLSGDQFTLGDGYLYVILSWAKNVKIDFSDLANLTRYFNELTNRKSVQKSLKDEGLIK